MQKIFVFAWLIALCACDGFDETLEADTRKFVVTVIDTEFCSVVLIEFKADDLAEITRITGTEGAKYYALNLNKMLVHPGQKLLVEVRKTTDEEYIACPTLLPTYPAIVLLSLKILL